jgi:hypothetical protein
MGEHEDARLRIISEGACPGLVKFLNEGHRENSLEEELMALESIYKLSQHLKNHNRMVGIFLSLLCARSVYVYVYVLCLDFLVVLCPCPSSLSSHITFRPLQVAFV